MNYLYSKQHYEDLYDKSTVKRCRWIENFHINYKTPDKIAKKATEDEIKGIKDLALYYDLLFTTGERYLERDKIIQEWLDRDTRRQKQYDDAEAPTGIHCLTCNKLMAHTFKMLYDFEKDKEEQVLFMYDCPQGCMPRRSFFEDGKEWRPKQRLCSKCGGDLKSEDKSTDKKSIITETCIECGDVKVDEHEFEKEKIDKEFAKDRERFCLSDEKGQEYIKTKQWFKDIETLVNDFKEMEEHKDEYDAVANLEKLTIVQLEKLLSPILEEDKFINLSFDKPDMDRDVRVGFTINDEYDNRDGNTSRNKLKKLIEKTLINTNWRLMSDGIEYRLGILTGRLRGYEHEEDLLKLVSSRGK